MADHDELVTITLDVAAISACNKVVWTAPTLINDTLDAVIEHFHPHAVRVLLGPLQDVFQIASSRAGSSGSAAARSSTRR